MLNGSSSLLYFKEVIVMIGIKKVVGFGCRFYIEHPIISHIILSSVSSYILKEVLGEEAHPRKINIKITKGENE